MVIVSLLAYTAGIRYLITCTPNQQAKALDHFVIHMLLPFSISTSQHSSVHSHNLYSTASNNNEQTAI